ncbi:MAG: Rrf2 family transcriptional regulator [Candidatus Moranbacteria bacterium]|nr:Rrf2 family transcriptional regulator [Candidatus Moranbacteria bacterium]
MKISKKAYYGLRAIVGIAHFGEISAHALAIEESLPEDYLQKILQQLKKARIISSEKGATGGYSLARNEKDISVWEILTVLDGEITPFTAPKMTNTSPYPKLTHCQTNLAWRKLSETIQDTLSNMSIADLITPPTGNNQSPNSKIKSKI